MTTAASTPEEVVMCPSVTEAERLHKLIADLVSGKAAWSSAARAVLDSAIEFHIGTIEKFEALFGVGTGWWCLPMLPPDRLLPFVTSSLYGDEYRPIVNTSDDGQPEWSSFFDADGELGCSAPAEKTASVRQAVALYFEESLKRGLDDEICISFVRLFGRRFDGSWVTVFTRLEEAAHSLQQVHDTLDFPASTAVTRVERRRPDGLGLWVYEVRSGNRLLAEYSPVHEALARKQLDQALNEARVQHYDFTKEATLRRLLADRMASHLAAPMSSRGESEQHQTHVEGIVL